MKTGWSVLCRLDSAADREVSHGALFHLDIQGCEEEADGNSNAVRWFFDNPAAAQEGADILRLQFPHSRPIVEVIEPQDWNARWRETIQPVRIAGDVWVAPDWRPPVLAEGEYWIRIEPRMAFGTGHHESTRLAAAGMLSFRERIRNRAFMDVGAGSGILCFYAAHMGAASVLGVENDMECFENLVENRSANLTERPLRFVLGPPEGLKRSRLYDVMTVNMIRTRSMPVITACRDLLIPSGVCIWTGLQKEERPACLEFAAAGGWTILKEMDENDWWGCVMERS